jgi:diaminohydroxyphosphoribosylaminopyrimidine deaminase/5-amino-6-(5-phosphoribosylamino)uracil reductase
MPVSSKSSPEAMIKTSAGRVENNAPKDRQGISSWLEFTQSFRAPSRLVVPPWTELFGPLKTGRVDDLVVVAQIGQSLDGRIATASGHSKYINGAAGLVHLHRLRSLVDVVIVGIGTALVDDPQLTVRLVEGPNPARVVIDPKARLPATAKVLTEDGVRRLIITADGTKYPPVLKTEILALPVTGGRIAPATIVAELAKRGLRRILIEGGAATVSNFLAAGCLDRLHVIVAPIILGDGKSSFILPSLKRADQAERLLVHAYQLDDEVLLDCDLSASRVPIGRAKKSR